MAFQLLALMCCRISCKPLALFSVAVKLLAGINIFNIAALFRTMAQSSDTLDCRGWAQRTNFNHEGEFAFMLQWV